MAYDGHSSARRPQPRGRLPNSIAALFSVAPQRAGMCSPRLPAQWRRACSWWNHWAAPCGDPTLTASHPTATVAAEVTAAVALQLGLARLLARATSGATVRENADLGVPAQRRTTA